MFVQADPTRSKGNNKKKSSDDRKSLKEIVLHEISHDSVVRHHPECIEDEIHKREADHEHQCSQLRPITNSNTDHEHSTHEERDDLKDGEVKVEEGEKHKDDKKAASKLHVGLFLVAGYSRNSSKHGLSFTADFS